MNILHGLPQKVVFCSKCLTSNQRPSSSPEFTKKDSAISTAGFDSLGICDACNLAKKKETINWEKRFKLLESLCDKYRKGDGSYDVVVPGSGGEGQFICISFFKKSFRDEPINSNLGSP